MGNRKTRVILSCVALSIGFAPLGIEIDHALANDSIASINSGGIQFIKETNISLEKEVLFINEYSTLGNTGFIKDRRMISVYYEFKNNSDKEIDAEVAFPIPEYSAADYIAGDPTFEDFTVKVNGQSVEYKTERRAYVDGKDVTDTLNEAIKKWELHAQIFLGYGGPGFKDLGEMDEAAEKDFIVHDLLTNDKQPRWSVKLAYHWHQVFPASSTTRINHIYEARSGYHIVLPEEADQQNMSLNDCVRSNLKWIQKNMKGYAVKKRAGGRLFYTSDIKYILTTANNWKGPIKDFTLQVETLGGGLFLLCGDNRLSSQAIGQAEVHLQNYSPGKDLEIEFLWLAGK